MTSKSLARRATATLLAGIAAYYAIWGGEYSAIDLWRLHWNQRSNARMLANARSQVDSLQVVADQLENDPLTIEAEARERFGMIRDGEILYRFVEVEETPPDPDRVPVP